MQKLVFEIAWEVVNKIGGIHTVIRTKAEETVNELGPNYFLVGPYNANQVSVEVELDEMGIGIIDTAVKRLRENGIKIFIGNWHIAGNPKVILFDIGSGYSNIDGWRHEFHTSTGIPIHVFDHEISDAIVFGGLVGWFLGEMRNHVSPGIIIMGHFHEWNSAVGLIFLRNRNVDISLIFTTHATLMGRHLSSGGCDLYNNLHNFDSDFEAGKRNFYSHHCIERCAAHKAHVFTTVSQITSDEAEAFLKRRPDLITPNGIAFKKRTNLHEIHNLHMVCKEIIHEFVRAHFFGSYYFDLDKTLYLFNAGRYEFSNKGVDVLLEAVYRLNNILKAKNIDTTVVMFLIFNAQTNNFNIESLKNQATVRQLRNSVEKIKTSIGERIFQNVVSGKIPDAKHILQPQELSELKKFLQSRKTGTTLPPIVTHNMIDDNKDPILCTLRRLKLFNSQEDKVKIVYHPQFLSSTSPLFPIDYDSFVRGCHFGLFPSYYEPWGYTPAECTSFGIPSMSTNLSGFGLFMEENIRYPVEFGIYIIDRRHKSVEESIDQITQAMLQFVKQSQKERIIQRNRCERLCELLDWRRMNKFYSKARLMAIERTHPDRLKYFSWMEDPQLHFDEFKINHLISPKASDASSEEEIPYLFNQLRIK